MASLDPISEWPWTWLLRHGGGEKIFLWRRGLVSIQSNLRSSSAYWRQDSREAQLDPALKLRLEHWAGTTDPLTAALEACEAWDLLRSTYERFPGWRQAHWLHFPTGDYRSADWRTLRALQGLDWRDFQATV